jgi:hypothetical protein
MAIHKWAGVRTMKKLLVGFTVLLVHTAAAHAQQPAPQPAAPAAEAPPPTPPQMPPAYAPPPGYVPPAAPPAYGAPPAYSPVPTYPPPPPYAYRPYRYAPYRYPAPAYYTPPPAPPPRDPLYRPFTLGGGIGFGGINFFDQWSQQRASANGLSYTFRLGFGLRPGLLLLWDVEGTAASYKFSTVSQTANLVALQVFATQRFFLKGGFGIADAIQDTFPTQWGAAAMGGLGYELIQGWNWSFDVEFTGTGAHFNTNGTDQTTSTWGLNFALNFF